MQDEQVIIGSGEHGMALDYLLVLQELAMEHGVSPQAILESTGIPLDALIRDNIRIGHRSFSQSVKNFLDRVDDPTLPIQYAKRNTMYRHGALGYAFQATNNLLETSVLLTKYVDTRSGGGQRFERDLNNDQVTITFHIDRQELGGDVERFQYLTLLFNIEYLGRCLTGTLHETIPSEIHLKSEQNGDIPESILPPGLKILFSQKANQWIAPKSYCERPLVTADPSVMPTAIEKIEQEMMSLETVVDIAALVREKLRKHVGKMPSLQQMADELHLSTSSLKRKLKEVGATYQQLRETELFNKANYLLGTTQYSVEQVAEMLGYGDASNFNKAFKQWSGMTPSEYRKQVNATT